VIGKVRNVVAVKEGQYGGKAKVSSWLYQIPVFRTRFALPVRLPRVGFSLGLLFGPEHEFIKFLRNVGGLPSDHTALHPRRQRSSLKNRITTFWDMTLCSMVAGMPGFPTKEWSPQLDRNEDSRLEPKCYVPGRNRCAVLPTRIEATALRYCKGKVWELRH
jgi:hypothetical protein